MVADATGATPTTSVLPTLPTLPVAGPLVFGHLCITTTEYHCRRVPVDDAAKDTTRTAVAGSNHGISDAFAIGTDDLIHANAGRLAQARSAPAAACAVHFHVGSAVFV